MGHMLQIFSLLSSFEALTELALGYVNLAAQCKTHGDNRGFERNLDRAQDAYAAIRLIRGERLEHNATEIIEIFPAISFSAESENTSADYAAKYVNKVLKGPAPGCQVDSPCVNCDCFYKPNAIANHAAALLAVPSLPAPTRKPVMAEVVRVGGEALARDFFDTFKAAHEWGCDAIGFYDGAVLRIRATVATDLPVYPVL